MTNNINDLNPTDNTGETGKTGGANTTKPNKNTKTKKPSSPRRVEASRANGAKSHGPVTPEGKARSSQNARKHGVLAAIVTLTEDDQRLWQCIFDQYAARFEPRDQVEYDLVEEIVNCKFQMRQAWIQQTSALGMQMSLDEEIVKTEWLAPSEHDRRVVSLTNSLKDSNTITLLQRYARTLSTQAERSIKLLLELKKLRLPPAQELARLEAHPELLNEPNPAAEHPEADHDAEPQLDPQPVEAVEGRPIYAYSSPVAQTPRIDFVRVKAETAAQLPLLAMAA